MFLFNQQSTESIILSKDISKDKKIEELKKIAKETVDIKGVGFYSLGSARKDLDENKKKYSNLFGLIFKKLF